MVVNTIDNIYNLIALLLYALPEVSKTHSDRVLMVGRIGKRISVSHHKHNPLEWLFKTCSEYIPFCDIDRFTATARPKKFRPERTKQHHNNRHNNEGKFVISAHLPNQ